MSENLALINYKLLKKARKSRKLSLIEASNGIIDAELLDKAEKEIIKIDFDSFRLLADRYKKNLTYFYLEKEPNLKLRFYWFKERMKLNFVNYLIKKWNLGNELF